MKLWKIAGAVAAAGLLAVGCSNRAQNQEGTGGAATEGTTDTEATTTTPSTEDTTSLPGSEMPAEPDTVPQGETMPEGTGGAGTMDESGATGTETPPTMDDEMTTDDPLDPSTDEPMDPATPSEGSDL